MRFAYSILCNLVKNLNFNRGSKSYKSSTIWYSKKSFLIFSYSQYAYASFLQFFFATLQFSICWLIKTVFQNLMQIMFENTPGGIIRRWYIIWSLLLCLKKWTQRYFFRNKGLLIKCLILLMYAWVVVVKMHGICLVSFQDPLKKLLKKQWNI